MRRCQKRPFSTTDLISSHWHFFCIMFFVPENISGCFDIWLFAKYLVRYVSHCSIQRKDLHLINSSQGYLVLLKVVQTARLEKGTRKPGDEVAPSDTSIFALLVKRNAFKSEKKNLPGSKHKNRKM